MPRPAASNFLSFVIGAVITMVFGVSSIFLVQQLNSKVYEYSSDHGKQGKRFQDSLAKVTLPLLFMGLGLIACSVVLSAIAFRGGAESGKIAPAAEDLDELLALIDGEKAEQSKTSESPGEKASLRRLRESINRLNLEVLEARKRERAVIERAVDVICITDINSNFVSVSKACLHAWGYTPKELEKKSLMEIIVSDDANNILNSILGSAKSIDKIVFECKLRKKNNELMDVVWTGHWSASDGGLFCIVHDITERKKAEELVKSSEIRLRQTLEGLPCGVLIVTNNGQIEFANREAARLLSVKANDLQGKKEEDYLSEKHSLEPSGENIESSGRFLLPMAGNSQRILATAKRADQSKFPVDISLNSIELGGEQKEIMVFLDKTKEQELEQMKREFIAMVTHDIRTPLSSVSGILALLEEGVLGELTDHGRNLISRVKSTCNRLLRLINDLLDLEKINAGKFALECQEISIKEAIVQALEDVLPLADERKIIIEHNSADGLKCFADEDRLVQVLVNLISNSIKYSPDESMIKIESEGLPEKIKVSVRDSGRGIPPEKISKVFSQFEQVDISDAKKKGGTGLGLAICQAIVKEHGGEIGVTSTYGEGSCFWFTIPRNA